MRLQISLRKEQHTISHRTVGNALFHAYVHIERLPHQNYSI